MPRPIPFPGVRCVAIDNALKKASASVKEAATAVKQLRAALKPKKARAKKAAKPKKR